jgi:hypothetical protein
MRHLQKYGKTVTAMVSEMDALHERLVVSPAVSVPAAAPQAGLAASRLTALMATADGADVGIIDSGANADACFKGAPLGNRAPAGAVITGATSQSAVAVESVGSLTMIAGRPNAEVHVSSRRMYELSSLPHGVYLFALSGLINDGWRLKHRASGQMCLETPPIGHHRRKLPLVMKKGILTIANVSHVVPGVVPQPSQYDGTSVYRVDARDVPVGLAATEHQPAVVIPPHPVLQTFMTFVEGHDALMAGLPDAEPPVSSSESQGSSSSASAGRAAKRPKVPRVSPNDRQATGSVPLSKNADRRAAQRAYRDRKLELAAVSERDAQGFDDLPPLYDRTEFPNGLPADAPDAAESLAYVVDLRTELPAGAVGSGSSGVPAAPAPPAVPVAPAPHVAQGLRLRVSTSGELDVAALAVAELEVASVHAVRAYRLSQYLRGPHCRGDWGKFLDKLNPAPVPDAAPERSLQDWPTPPIILRRSRRHQPVPTVASSALASEAILRVVVGNSRLPAAHLAMVAAVNRRLRSKVYGASEMDVHGSINPWCRTAEYLEAIEDAPCLHPHCHCTRLYQQLSPALRRDWLETYLPVQVVRQRMYDRRFGVHNGQPYDSPTDRTAVILSLRARLPWLSVGYDSAGRLSIDWSPGASILTSVDDIVSALAIARLQSSWARGEVADDPRQLPIVAACYRCKHGSPYDLLKCSRPECDTWVHTACELPQCPHYVTGTDCGTTLYQATQWQCPKCAPEDSDSDGSLPELVSSSSESGSDSDYSVSAGFAAWGSATPYIRRRRSMSEACTSVDKTDPFHRGRFYGRNACNARTCAKEADFFRESLQRPQAERLPPPLVAELLSQGGLLTHPVLGAPLTGASFMRTCVDGSCELAAALALVVSVAMLVPEASFEIQCNMAICNSPAPEVSGGANRHRRRRGSGVRVVDSAADRDSPPRSPPRAVFRRPAPAAPRKCFWIEHRRIVSSGRGA